MPIATQKTVRKFIYNGVPLPDPNPAISINEVQSIHAATHAEIANAAIDGPEVKGAVQTYTYVKSVGTKG